MYSAGIGELYPRRGVVPAKKYRIELTTEEQQELKALVSKGRAAAYKQTHARILLLSDEARKDGGLTDEEVCPVPRDRQRHSGTDTPPLRGGRDRSGLGA